MANQFLIKNSMADMRALSAGEITALQNGTYDGVQLLGYYEKGDTAAPIIYYLAPASPDPGADDGGSIIAVQNSKLQHEFVDHIDARYFGVSTTIADNTTKLQKLVNLAIRKGLNVYLDAFYGIKSLVIDQANNIKFYSNNGGLSQSEAGRNFISLTNSSKIAIEGLKLKGFGQFEVPQGESGIYYHNVYISDCNEISFSNCEIYNAIRGGILSIKTNNLSVYCSRFYQNRSMFDVSFGYSVTTTARNIGFTCTNSSFVGSNSYGIHCMGGGSNYIITGNRISDKNEYGIVFYHLGTDLDPLQVIDNIVISNNLVENISDGTGTDAKGMGIYLQTVEKAVVSDNIVRNTLIGRDTLTVNRQLSPAAISINGSREVTCTGNLIEKSRIDGIGVTNSVTGSRGTIIANNVVLGIKKTGISLYTVNNCAVQGNIIEGNCSNEAGIDIHSSAARRSSDISVSGNQIKSGFRMGINTFKSTGSGFDRISITDNRINDCELYYIYLSAVNVLKCEGNTISNDIVTMVAGGSGIRVDANENLLISNNVLIGSPTVKLKRGLQSSNNVFGKISDNIIRNIQDPTYRLYSVGESLDITNNLLE